MMTFCLLSLQIREQISVKIPHTQLRTVECHQIPSGNGPQYHFYTYSNRNYWGQITVYTPTVDRLILFS
jgi:hypothetical protein